MLPHFKMPKITEGKIMQIHRRFIVITEVLMFVLLVLVVSGCRDHGVEMQPLNEKSISRNLSVLEKSVVSSDNSFGLKLFSCINANEPDKNVFISPLSVSMALGMALNGANGATLDSMKYVLEHSGFSLQEINDSYKNISSILTHLDPKVVFQIANSLWCRHDLAILPSYLSDCRTYFDAEATSLDFTSPGAVQAINGWVNSKTNGKIPTIIDQIPSEIVLYLINAIYFKGVWTYQFDPTKTTDASFTTSLGNSISCKMMAQKATYAYYASEELQVIDLSYGERSFSMTIILPAQGKDIDQFAGELTQQQWNGLVNALDSTEVDLSMPKFKLEYEKNLNSELHALGMGIAFSDFADFSRITHASLAISEVKHKTFVEVNEEGTEAAAVTSIGFRVTSLPSNPSMTINRPFIFAIREHASGTILFVGKIVNPNP
jgi:serine protease inhibitor